MACHCWPIRCGDGLIDIHPVRCGDASDSADDWLRAISTHMRSGLHGNAAPEHLSGVFWMDGNAPEHLLTLLGGDFAPAARRTTLRTYAPGVWADSYRRVQRNHKRICCVYEVLFNEAYDFAHIDVWQCGCCCIPRSCADFTMVQHKDDPDVWDRPSVLCCGLFRAQYVLRRVAHPEPGTGRWVATKHLDTFASFMSTRFEGKGAWVYRPRGGTVVPTSPDSMQRG